MLFFIISLMFVFLWWIFENNCPGGGGGGGGSMIWDFALSLFPGGGEVALFKKFSEGLPGGMVRLGID